MDLKNLSQPYVGDVAAFQDALFPVRTTAQLSDATDPINTKDKFTGRLVFNSTTSLPAWAAGPGATADWVSADITVGVDITPS
jgi:hypothetical protein